MGLEIFFDSGTPRSYYPYKVTQLFWFSEKKREKKTHGNKIKSEKPLFGEDFFRVVEQF